MTRPPNLHAVRAATIDGAELLTRLHGALTTYVAFPSAEAADAATLYVAASHAQPAWEHASRLVIKSPLKRCGKSRLQEVIAETCHRPLRTANCSTAALVRSIGGDDPPTILLDEADSVFGGRKAAKDGVAEDLRGFINAGHSRGAPYLRWDMMARQLEECPTFGMAVLAGIGDLPDTIEDRAIVISMRRRGNGEHVASFRRRSIPALHELREHLNAWVREHLTVLRDAEPDLPVEDRAADVWEPLVSIADLAGDDWPNRARRSCTVLAGVADSEADSAGERLLSDLYQVWGDEDCLFTNSLLERLHKLDESPWGDWYGKPLAARGLATLLRPYGVKSRNVRGDESHQAKGYLRADLSDAWGRYVPAVPPSQDDETAGQGWDGTGTDSRTAIRPRPDQDEHTRWDAGTDGTDTRPDLFDAARSVPASAPATPTPCRVCGVEMTPEQAGRYDRCASCWADLLAAQPVEATETP